MSVFKHVKMYWGFTAGLRSFLTEQVTLQESRDLISLRLQSRNDNFLLTTRKAIYENKTSLYLKLLQLAGCEYGDLQASVRSKGLESTLKKLAGEGVYVTTEEFKGKKEVIRHGKVFVCKESDFDNPFVSGHLEALSGGSRSAGTRTAYDYQYLRDNRSVYNIQMLNAYGLNEMPFGLWSAIMPGGGPMFLLTYTKAGKIPARWFSPVNEGSFKPSLKNRFGTNYIVYMGRIFGKKLPFPQYVKVEDAWKVAQWISGMVKQYGGCCLHCYTSLAVRICQIAGQKGLDIKGAVFVVGENR